MGGSGGKVIADIYGWICGKGVSLRRRVNDTNINTHTHKMNINTHYDINSLYLYSLCRALHNKK